MLPFRRIQYVNYLIFLAGFAAYFYSYFGNTWYIINYDNELQGSFVEIKYYSEGLLSVCWFGDCIKLSLILEDKSLKTIYISRLLMVMGVWILTLSFMISFYKLYFTPDWHKSKTLFFFLGLIDLFAGTFICSATFNYLYFNELALDNVGYFDFGCYAGWLSGTLFVIYGMINIALASSIFVPFSPNVPVPQSTSLQLNVDEPYKITDILSPPLYRSSLLPLVNYMEPPGTGENSPTIPSSVFNSSPDRVFKSPSTKKISLTSLN